MTLERGDLSLWIVDKLMGVSRTGFLLLQLQLPSLRQLTPLLSGRDIVSEQLWTGRFVLIDTLPEIALVQTECTLLTVRR